LLCREHCLESSDGGFSVAETGVHRKGALVRPESSAQVTRILREKGEVRGVRVCVGVRGAFVWALLLQICRATDLYGKVTATIVL